MLDEIQESVGHLPFSTDVDGSPAPTIDCIKSNLGLERDLSRDIEEATEAYNIAVCHTIGPATHSRLPRELRDMIYEYLTAVELDLRIEHDPAGSDKLPQFAAYFAQQPRSENDKLCPERYWRDGVVGSEVAYELMQSWYQNSTFKLVSRDRDQCLQALLNKDRFDADLQPRELITKFTHQFELGDSITMANADVLRCLDGMFLFSKVTQLQVLVAFSHCRDKVGALIEFLALIHATILRLRKLGYLCSVFVPAGLWPDKLFEKIIKEWEEDIEAEMKRGGGTALSGI
jgi:hypothetical protein